MRFYNQAQFVCWGSLELVLRRQGMLRIAVLILLSLGMFSLPASAADSESQQKAQDAFDSIYGADVKRVRATKDTADDAALAAKILESARAVEAQPEFLAILCTNACELAAADPKGAEAAQAACDLAIEKALAAAGACQDAIVTMRRRQYDAARGDAKAQACDVFIEALAAAADTRLRGGDTEGAHIRILKAATLARQTKSQKADTVEAQLRAVTARQKSAAEAERLKKQVEADPANAKARDQLVRLLVVDLDSPAEAAKYVDESSDATLRKFVPAAAKAVADAPEMACLALTDWYMQLAATAGPAGKAAMYARAVQYGERFMELHTAQDLDRTRAELAVKKAREAAAGNVRDPFAVGQWIDLLKLIDIKRDVLSGQWERTNEGLNAPGPGFDISRVQVPLKIFGNYELEVKFRKTLGHEANLVLPVGRTRLMLVLGGWDNRFSGLELIAGRSSSNNETTVDGAIETNRTYTVRIRVAIDRESARIEVFLDNKPYIKWAGRVDSLSLHMDWALRDVDSIGLACRHGTLFIGARLRMLSGKAVPLRPATLTVSAGNKPPVGKLVIVKAVYGDLQGGKWTDVTQKVAAMVKDNTLSVDATNENFGDPADWCVKKLRVDYTFNGVAKSKTVDEGMPLTISATGE
jgi:hypothetical protein